MRRAIGHGGRRHAALAILLGSLAGCGVADRNYLHLVEPARPEWRPSAMSLAEKAAWFEADLERFLSPDGLLLYRQQSDGVRRYGSHADACAWTGVLLGAEALRHAVEPGEAVRARVDALVGGLELLHEVTGVPGLLARTAVPRAALAAEPFVETGVWYDGSAARPDYRFKGDVSKDQYCGAVFGLHLAYRHVRDEGLRARVRALATAFADHILENDFQLIDPDGEPTRFGNLDARIYLMPVGINALTVLSIVRLAAWTSGEEKYHAAYQALVEDGWPEVTYWSKLQVLGLTGYSNDNMSFLLYYTLLCLEDDPAVRRCYRAALERTWWYVEREGNAFFNLIAATFGEGDELALADARRNLEVFPLDRRTLSYDLCNDPRITRAWLPNRKGEPCADAPLPLHCRRPSSFIWKTDPYVLLKIEEPEGAQVYSGVDYLVAYWLGRHHGYFRSRD
jgi:hypothetical protein